MFLLAAEFNEGDEERNENIQKDLEDIIKMVIPKDDFVEEFTKSAFVKNGGEILEVWDTNDIKRRFFSCRIVDSLR